MNTCKMNWLIIFGEYPAAYLKWTVQTTVSLCQCLEISGGEPITKQLFLTQDYFKTLSMTQLKAKIAEKLIRSDLWYSK